MHEEKREPTEEELQAALEEQMRQIRVEEILLQTVATLVNLAARRLGLAGDAEEKELDQARLAIDAARALMPVCPEDQVEPIKQALSQLQMAYAREAQAGPPTAGAQPLGTEEEASQPVPPDDPERAKARSKIWTPPGA